MNLHARLGNTFLKEHPQEAARVLEDFPVDRAAHLLASAGPGIAEAVMQGFSPGFAANCLAMLDPGPAARLLAGTQIDTQVELLRQLDIPQREAILHELQPERSMPLRRMLPYPDNTAGALMQAPLLSVPEDLSVRAALKRARRARREMKIYIYVTDGAGRLRGVMTLHELLNAPPGRTVAEVMQGRVISLSADESIFSVIRSPYWQSYHALPVIDANGLLLGVIRQKSIHHYMDQLDHAESVRTGLDLFMATGELFAYSAGQLLADLIVAGGALLRGKQRSGVRTGGNN